MEGDELQSPLADTPEILLQTTFPTFRHGEEGPRTTVDAAEHKCKPENYVDDDEDEDAKFLQFTTSSSQTAKLDALKSCPCTIGRALQHGGSASCLGKTNFIASFSTTFGAAPDSCGWPRSHHVPCHAEPVSPAIP